MENIIVVIGAACVLDELRRKYELDHTHWLQQCRVIKASYKQKTSRMVKGEKEYVYTQWYKLKSGGGLESAGNKEPDWNKLNPPEPKPKEVPGVAYSGHLLVEEKDYTANRELFREYLAFPLDECVNLAHPLFVNPENALKNADSVRKSGVSSARSQISGGTETKESVGELFNRKKKTALRDLLGDDMDALEEDETPDDDDELE